MRPRALHCSLVASALAASALVASALVAGGCGGGRYDDDLAASAAAAGRTEVFESFEALEPWAVDSADDPAALTRSRARATHGTQSLRAAFTPGPRRKVSIRRDVELDLYGVRSVTVDAWAPVEGLALALALVTNPGHVYYESRSAKLPSAAKVAEKAAGGGEDAAGGGGAAAADGEARAASGWTTITFRLDVPHFKCAESDWQTNSLPANLNSTARLLLVLYTGEAGLGEAAAGEADAGRAESGAAKSGEVCFDRMTFDKPIAEVESKFAPRNVVARAPARVARVWGRFEVEVEFAASHGSPFDPREVAVYADFAAPSGRMQRATGFAGDDGVWRIRYMPLEPGRHTYEVSVWNRVGKRTLPVESFVAGGERAPGPVRVSARDPRHFEFAVGRPFYPVGINIAWATDFRPYFESFADAGGNLVRVWLAPWSLPVASRTKAGEVDTEAADRLEEVLDLAHECGLLVQLVLAYHGEFRDAWRESPYNAENGGPCAVPGDFFVQGEANAAFRSFIRYVAARFGTHPALFAWELFNEADLVPAFTAHDVVRWHARMASALRSYDPTGRPITTSVCRLGRLPEIEELDRIDFLQGHYYRRDLDDAVLDHWVAHATRHKPTVIGEFGAHWRPRVDQEDTRGVRARTGLWLSLASPASGTALPWWWDVQVDPNELWDLWRPVSALARRIDRRGKRWRFVNQAFRAAGTPGSALGRTEGAGGKRRPGRLGAQSVRLRDLATADAATALAMGVPTGLRRAEAASAAEAAGGLSAGVPASAGGAPARALPPQRARVHGILTRTEGLLYFYDPRVLDDPERAPSVLPGGGAITVRGLVDGPYRVETWTGTDAAPSRVADGAAAGGELAIALPREASDFAVYFHATRASEPGIKPDAGSLAVPERTGASPGDRP